MIYCVEDDSSIRDLMVYTLRAAGFSAEGFADGEVFWQAMQQEIPELVMLDIMLPGEDGIAILKKLRAAPATAEIPVIMATAKDTEYDRVIGLDLGAPIPLTLTDYDLLRLFLENPGQVFTRDRLLSAVWGADYYGETRTVDVHIGTLRTKLGTAGDILQTVRGVGYKLEAPHE